jgi:hypothetical protein
VRAYEIYTKQGEGDYGISISYDLPGVSTTRQVDSLRAGEAITKTRKNQCPATP